VAIVVVQEVDSVVVEVATVVVEVVQEVDSVVVEVAPDSLLMREWTPERGTST
jgi:hypothetical protein